jgi:UDP-2,4-diacetamido-2,4,6-trideoxy-beta-L-altropyranose hydrolase
MIKQTIVVRSDSTLEIGTGHIMRCLALSQAWQDEGGKVIFVCAQLSPALESRLLNEKIKTHYINSLLGSKEDATDTILFAKMTGAKWIVLDGYHFGAEYQKVIKESGLSLLFIDDYGHAEYYHADIVLNQNIYADMSYYPKYEPYTRFLLGTKYALIRKEFLKWSGWHRDIPEVARKILVTLGGSDPDNVTLKVIEAVKTVDVKGIEAIIVVGSTNPHFDVIQETVKDHSHFTLIKNAENMPELMAWADVAISAGGSTCWELAYLGTPFIAITIADNQKPVVMGISAQKATVNLGNSQILTQKKIANMIKKVIKSINKRSNLSKNLKKLVDGEGVSRVIMEINSDHVRLRTTMQSDCATILNWANDPIVRKSAFNTADIPITDHESWFFQKNNDPNCYFFIGLDKDDTPIGQIRFDLIEDIATVDISIDKKWRGKGYAKSLLNLGIHKLLRMCNVTIIKAYIKKENINSIKTFRSCNFEFSENKIIKNSEAIVISRKIL